MYAALTTQCIKMGIPLLDSTLPAASELSQRYDIVVDALFGFSFRGPPRPEFANIIRTIIDSQLPVVSVDVPSGMCTVTCVRRLQYYYQHETRR